MDAVGRIPQDERCGSSQLTVGLVHGGDGDLPGEPYRAQGNWDIRCDNFWNLSYQRRLLSAEDALPA